MARQTSKQKSARYRQRINADPVARAEYLARKKESYQRRKQKGNIKSIKSDELSKIKRKKQKDSWKASSKGYRERKKIEQLILKMTPPSLENTPPCPWYEPITVDPTATVRQAEKPEPPGEQEDVLTENPASSPPEPPRQQESVRDLCGRFVIVTYDELPYVGQVLKVVDEELQISCMQQSDDKNLFLWPKTPDVTFYLRKDVHSVISEPTRATSRFSKLICQDWVTFRNFWG
ncbi:uncharacterized protein LOC133447623 [Cololabis saira]|uniref:uncharacterized protein LOC133447623 n=1 Tax=Cololabis saira TaxID=129043 RepID=UPI002AD3A93B|nr:uncharacterized protein LOC133447623 [Cololabis saira]